MERREAEELQATLDRIDPEGAVRQQQAGLVAAWSASQARLSRAVTDVMAFDLDEIGPLLDEVNRYAVRVGIDHLHNYCSALERMLAATAALHVIDGSGSRPLDPTNTGPASTGRRRSTKRTTGALPPRLPSQVVAMTADMYRDLIQKYVDQARADRSIAERLADEARQRFGAEIHVPKETE